MQNNSLLKKKSITTVLLTVVILCLPMILTGLNSDYIILVCCFAELYIIATAGLDLLFGYCGQISMGHAAYFAIGAYGSGLLRNYTGMPVLACMLVSMVISAVIGAIIAFPCAKLKFHFLSLATIAFNNIIYLLLVHSPGGITNDLSGMFSDRFELFGIVLDSYTACFYFGLVCVVVFLFVKQRIVNSKVGRAFVAIRENAHAADGMGIDVRKYKIIAFAVSAAFVAFAGAFYMHLVGYVHPDTFQQKQSVMFLTMLLLGGSGSLIGPIIGVVIIELMMESLRALQNYQMLIYGCVLLIVILLIPGGVYGETKKIVSRIKSKMGQKFGGKKAC